MKTFLIFAVIGLALSGASARPRHHRSHQSHRSHRQADCSEIDYRSFSPKDVVCGSDGKTYVNEQHLSFENCLNDEDVTVAKKGWCNEEIQIVEALKDIIWTLASSFLEDMFKDASPAALEELLGIFFAISGEDVSGEDILNFLKDNDSDENVSEALGDVVKLLGSLDKSSEGTDGESLDKSSEGTDGGEVEDDSDEEVSVIGDDTSVINDLPEPVYEEATFDPEEDSDEESNLIPDVLLD